MTGNRDDDSIRKASLTTRTLMCHILFELSPPCLRIQLPDAAVDRVERPSSTVSINLMGLPCKAAMLARIRPREAGLNEAEANTKLSHLVASDSGIIRVGVMRTIP